MVIGRLVDGEPVLIDRLREQVQLAEGLDDDRNLSPEARERALSCLERFGQRLRELSPQQVRAVGTNTLRASRHAEDFLDAAQAALGHPIEIISGPEEARLIYLGVAHKLADDSGTRLVIDIGGGSTECILGERFESLLVHSLHMGCVSWSKQHFPDGKLSAKAMDRAELAARRELKGVARSFRDTGWTEAVGSSGTIRALAEIVRANELGPSGLTPQSLAAVREMVLAAKTVESLSLSGLKPERASVLAGGLAILRACFESLGIEQLKTTSGALREGVLYDLLGRIRHEDVRERTVSFLQERYGVDRAQAARVERTALSLIAQVTEAWDLKDEALIRLLGWAARLHELGLTVAFRHHHRHGAYLLRNADLPGFSRDEQYLLAAIVGTHRRKPSSEILGLVPRGERHPQGMRLIVLLRLAALLNRARAPLPPLPLSLEAKQDELVLHAPKAWLEDHPLTRLDLEEECRVASVLGLTMSLDIES